MNTVNELQYNFGRHECDEKNQFIFVKTNRFVQYSCCAVLCPFDLCFVYVYLCTLNVLKKGFGASLPFHSSLQFLLEYAYCLAMAIVHYIMIYLFFSYTLYRYTAMCASHTHLQRNTQMLNVHLIRQHRICGATKYKILVFKREAFDSECFAINNNV